MVTKLLSLLFGGNSKSSAPGGASVATLPVPASGDEPDLVGFVDFVVKSLVSKIDEVKVTSETDDQGLLIRIRCNQEEVGRIIGRSGKTIRAIRSLVKGAAARHKQRASVIVMEE